MVKDERYRFKYDPRDNEQQRRCLRRNRAAQRARNMFPAGTRVTTRPFGSTEPHPDGQQGTVIRHVPGNSAQGGYVRVQWDNGGEGTVGPGTIIPVKEA